MAFFYEDKPLAENAFSWSITAASNGTADPAVPFPENMLPGAVNDSARALMAGVARWIADTNGSITTGGSAGSYSVTSYSGHTSLTNGIVIWTKASATNTAGATLNLNTLGAKSIRAFSAGAESAVAAGQMVINGTYQFRYDTAANSAAGGWILLNPSPDPAVQVKTGATIIWNTDTLPDGFLWANGALVSRTTYAALFGVIGTNFGAGDGSTTFAVPDMCGRAPFGTDDMGGISAKNRITVASGFSGTALGSAAGLEVITLATAQIPAHSHTGTTDNGGVDHIHTGPTDSGGVDHTHLANAPAATTGQFVGPIGANNGWSGPSGNGTATGSASAFAHTHNFTTSGASVTLHTHPFTTAAAGGGASHNNMPPGILLNFIIKT